eukprot:CAMPEP_0172379350 /NCGR_PEP_ID=MMETSP1060-20121228/69889_1 /TAXON_ID=37318 /ORGANISM="Pseudo-nitzschia pungens, Strain cf. cingulata" /LENGTH=495 /DNA_ID=CAMNT_0013107091 /DNA_START=27 /DNA_END=1515 /DNA_ORIENTATION=+
MMRNRLVVKGDLSQEERQVTVVEDALRRLDALQQEMNRYHQEQNRKSASLKRRRQTEEEERWDMQTLLHNKKSTPSAVRKILNDLKELVRIWTSTIPELLSKIQHASKALFKEVSRGFFLPFCTVALSAMARIRCFLMEIGAKGLVKLKELEFVLSDSTKYHHQQQQQQQQQQDERKLLLTDDVYKHCRQQQQQQQQQQQDERKLLLTDDVYKHCMNLFVENQNDNERHKRSMLQSASDGSTNQHMIVDRSAILRSLGLTESASTSTASSKVAPPITADREEMDADDVDSVTMDKVDSTEKKPDELQHGDYYTLATSELEEESELVDEGIETSSGLDPSHQDSLDSNMALVDQFRKRKNKNDIQSPSNDQDKKSRKKKKSVTKDVETREEEPKKKKHKSKSAKELTKSKKKKKTKKDKGGDFFDDILVDGSSGDLYIGSCLFSKSSTKTYDTVPFQMEHQQEGNSTSNHSDNATTNTFNDSNVIRIYLVPILHLI